MSIYRGKTTKEFYLATLLYDSIEDRDLSSVKSLLSERGADPNIVLPRKGIAPFHLAIGCDSNNFSISLTSVILQYGGNPNVRSDDGLTPVHIAAAWGRVEILQLLLSCGGDPEVRDINHKTPLHYAHEEKFVECLNLLKSYLPRKNDIFNKEDEDCVAYNLILDKILVNNGSTIGEYEIVNEYKTDSIMKNVQNLQSLPQSDTTEYVMNWFKKHVDLPEISTVYPHIPKTSTASSTDGIDSFESSVDESDNEHNKPINPEHITFRKVYTKTRKISKGSNSSYSSNKSSPCYKFEDAQKSLQTTQNNTTAYADAEDFTDIKNYSKESGIVTLPNSSKDLTSILLEDETLSPIKNDEEGVKIANDVSSDYMTCSHSSLPSFLEKNIFELTEDLSHVVCSSEESKTEVKSVKSNGSEKSEGIGSTDLSFVSVSEVYKYIDKDEGIILYERRLLKTPSECNGSVKSSSFSSKLSSLPETIDYDTDTLRKELTAHGYQPGPITVTTKRVYLKKLRQLKTQPMILVNQNDKKSSRKVYSLELEKTFRDPNWFTDISSYKTLEDVLLKQFSTPDPSRKWREGVNKSSFTYLLLDPRVTNNLPCRAEQLQPKEIWETFLSAIFYVGKGKRTRPYSHLYEAVNLWNQGIFTSENKKLQHILDIWKSNGGVICLHVFQNIIPVEAYTREAAMISALKIENVRNLKAGDFYGTAATWPQKQKKMLGVYLLHKAMMIFLNEGERQLCPADID